MCRRLLDTSPTVVLSTEMSPERPDRMAAFEPSRSLVTDRFEVGRITWLLPFGAFRSREN